MTLSREEKVCFESKLAAAIQANPQYFPAVNKISDNILQLLDIPANRAYILENQLFTDDVMSELFSDTYYGTLDQSLDFCPSQEDMLIAFSDKLSERPVSDLPAVMHLHQLFSQKFYDQLPEKVVKHNDVIRNVDRSKLSMSQRVAIILDSYPQEVTRLKNKVANRIFNNDYFKIPARQKTGNTGQMTDNIGVANPEKCRVQQKTKPHQNILGVFLPTNSKWLEEINTLEQPFLAGPSGHTGSSLLMSVMIGNLSADELKEYVTAVMGLLVGGGYHHIHEVGVIAKRIGIPYQANKHYSYLPERFLTDAAMQELSAEYPELLIDKNSQPVTSAPWYEPLKSRLLALADNVADKLVYGAAAINELEGSKLIDPGTNRYFMFNHTQTVALATNSTAQISGHSVPALGK
ncbi:hypothetical protein [Legionella quinlivanii]|uniref:hypothetical protein n=1 Tax=Legionella quinlivanii TaxID=45073 RepID=UPI002243B35E|nr:hypothetical protein [Legionella quinlivanii]MCW8450966.1 hypothetical protein [Legionella quinlivanii]